MVQSMQKHSLQQWLTKLFYLYEELMNQGDRANAEKMKQLIKKVHKEEFIIAFCGHFSAGKSSMINELIGETILPSSPIPTSANLVKVKSGREYARVFYKHEPPIEYPAPYNYEEIKSYCKDGDTIESIEISHNTDRIPKGVVIMDTPGIDSTDDAHRLATESALHLADVVFYVMDYNHVQSELNFQFTKELTDHGKPVYLIVNQIDKHRDEELTFSDFKRSVIQAFRDWNVKVEQFFFTSLKQHQLPHNEFNRLTSFLQTLFSEKEERLETSTKTAVKQLLHDHLFFLQEKDAQEEEQLTSRLQVDVNDDALPNRVEHLQNEIDKIEKQRLKMESQFRQELQNVLEHAYIMPFETRELARSFIESIQPDFKVGLFFSKAKTAAERERRLQAFYENVKEKVRSQMEWHVRELLSRFIREHEIMDNDLVKEAQQLTVTFTADLLASIVKKGAGLTGDYILTYTSDVANEFKKRYRNEAMRIFEQAIAKWQEKADADVQALRGNLMKEIEQMNVKKRLDELKQKRNQMYRKLLQFVEKEEMTEMMKNERISELVEETFVVRTSKQETDIVNNKKVEDVHPSNETERSVSTQGEISQKTQKAAEDLYRTAQLIADVKGMNRFVKELTEKARRLENRSFTVALFGAFSAGKSSFANALIGGKVLPVSPNPTTATINKIVPPTMERPHGTVIVQLKAREQIYKDLQSSLRYFDLKAQTLEEAFIMSQKALQVQSVDAREKPHYSFIKAVVEGYEKIQSHLGQMLQVDLDMFGEYVADEAKACFVEWIELYYDCPLTQQGITLVDTPGADSVNARHTGVAFEYIKNADAVLFVTYYNHAFSKADREFLIQLGRVKDTFSMDKMFFIVNAADLAHSYEELDNVLSYVEEQLVRFGIRKPRLYPVSSRFALDEKTGGKKERSYGILTESGIRRFEADFTHFIIDELTSLAVASAYAELERVRMTLSDYITESQQSIEAKQAKLQKMKEDQVAITELLRTSETETDIRALEQEISELVYYIKQRVFLRFNDWFKETFNPAVLREDGRDIKKALQSCLQELLNSIGFDLAQEMRATSLRVEKFIVKKLHERFVKLEKEIQFIHKELPISNLETYEFTTPEFAIGLEHIDETRFKKALSFYKNAKAFFEHDEKRLMKDELEKQLQQPVADYLAENEKRLAAQYIEEFMKAVQQLNMDLEKQVTEYFTGLTAALTEPMNVEHLEMIEAQLRKMIEEAKCVNE
jgi:small GTP-binding protein